MDYRLQVFCEVANQQSITAAAKILHLSQPAVTQHIKALEEKFRTSFFIRSRRGATLTEAGVTLLAHAREINALEETLIEKLRHPGQTFQGRLRVGASTTITQYYLPKILALFKKQHATVTVEILEENSTSIIATLLDQRIDIGLIEGPCRRRDLRAYSFFEDEIVLIASPKNALFQKHAISIKKLLQVPLIFREQGSGTRQHVEEHLRRANIPLKQLNIIQELPSSEAIKRAVMLEMGLGFISRLSITNEIAHDQLKILNVPSLKIQRYFYVLLPLGPDPIGLRQAFLKQLK